MARSFASRGGSRRMRAKVARAMSSAALGRRRMEGVHQHGVGARGVVADVAQGVQELARRGGGHGGAGGGEHAHVGLLLAVGAAQEDHGCMGA
ncbi:MAG: hypothetical protein ACLTDR_05685 [Adlercreutzia equolifaciens]